MIISCKCRFIYKIVWMMIFTTFKKIFVIFSHIVFFRSFNSIINFLFFSSFYFSSLLQPHLDIYLSFLSHYLLLYSFPFIQFYSIFLSFIFFYYLFFSFFFFFYFFMTSFRSVFHLQQLFKKWCQMVLYQHLIMVNQY